jgi:hypothetical protein
MTRHHLAALGLLLAFFAASACADGTSLDNFDVEISEQTVAPGATPLDLLLNSFPQLDAFTGFDLSQQQDFKNSSYTPRDVDSVTLTSFTLSAVDPPTQDLSFLGSMTLFLETKGLPRKEIARCERFPEGQTRAVFQTSPDDLKDYVLATESTLTVDVKDSKRPQQDTTLQVDAIFDVDVKVF